MAWGSIAGAVAGNVLGNILGNRKRKKAKEDQINSFSRIREGAEKAGFNPLTALGSPAAGGFSGLPSGGIAPLASVDLIRDTVKGVSDIATGEAAKEAARRDVDDRLQRLKLERLEAGNAGEVSARTNGARLTSAKPGPVTARPARSSRAAREGEKVLNIAAGFNTVDPVKPAILPNDGGKAAQKVLETAQQFNPGRAAEMEPTKDLPFVGSRTIGEDTRPVLTSDGEEIMGLNEMLGLPVNYAAASLVDSWQNYRARDRQWLAQDPANRRVVVPGIRVRDLEDEEESETIFSIGPQNGEPWFEWKRN